MNTFPPGVELAVMFPPDLGFKGACTTVADIAKLRFSRCWDRGTKWLACDLIMRHAFDCYASQGHGNKAARREAELALSFSPPDEPMTNEELDDMLNKMNRQYWADRQAELKTEGRT